MSGNRQASDLTARIQARTLYANVIATRKLIEQGCNTTATTQSGSAADNAQSLLPTLALGARLTTAAERDAILAPVCAPVGCLLSGDTLTILQFTTIGATTWECPCSVTSIEYLVVGGGGGGGSGYDTAGAGGGGAGLVLAGTITVIPNTIYAVEVGDGGAGGTMVYPPGGPGQEANGSDGEISRFDTIYASEGSGGFGSRLPSGLNNGGGGSQAVDPTGGSGGRGGGSTRGGGGGGGNGSAGGNGSGATPGSGGIGVSMSISGSAVTYGAGGNGARGNTITTGADATANSGNGGGGGGYTSGGGRVGGAGGSGIVIIKYYQ